MNKIKLLHCVLGAMAAWPALALNLFEGESLEAFHVLGDANWRVEGQGVRADSGRGMLVTRESYGDFRLTLEFYPESQTNSGVFLRCANPQAIDDKSCYEVNIFDSRPDPSGRTGAVVHVAPPLAKLDTEGQWNTYEIVVRGSHLQVKLNGTVTVDTHDRKLSYGPVALQYASGGIRFRNAVLESLDADVSGVWDLTQFELHDGKGQKTEWCPGAYGSILYGHGAMAVSINCASDPSKMVFYSGPYHTEGSTVVHEVKNASASRLMQTFRRGVEFPDPDRLHLVGPFGQGGKAVVSWQRRE